MTSGSAKARCQARASSSVGTRNRTAGTARFTGARFTGARFTGARFTEAALRPGDR
ncbi:pentapeptide repeat-containing protein [Streptomyces sp. HMX87]|uniref:pentapeptide repeat-containing protein n=1 Tax=Streptomyces sp. HMX87 TaxID=3390849 RepID=UPI003A838B76